MKLMMTAVGSCTSMPGLSNAGRARKAASWVSSLLPVDPQTYITPCIGAAVKFQTFCFFAKGVSKDFKWNLPASLSIA